MLKNNLDFHFFSDLLLSKKTNKSIKMRLNAVVGLLVWVGSSAVLGQDILDSCPPEMVTFELVTGIVKESLTN